MSINKNNRSNTSLQEKIMLVFFGLLLTLIILEFGLRLGGFSVLFLQERQNQLSLRRGGEYKILCLGESTTADKYPSYLEEVLKQRKSGIKFSVINKGISGINTSYILSRLESNLEKYRPDMVITMMGINDAGLHMPHEIRSNSEVINFLKSFRTYKLAKLLWLHIVTRLNGLQPDQLIVKELKFKIAIALNPKNDRAYVKLGNLYRDQHKSSESEAAYKKAIELNPESYEAYCEQGYLYRYLGKIVEAEVAYKKAIELNPKNGRAYFFLGLFYRYLGKASEAEACFKKTMELDPNNPNLYIELGWFYRDQGRISEAEASFTKAIEINFKNNNSPGQLKRVCEAREFLYTNMENFESVREYSVERKALGGRDYSLLTINNYRTLQAILNKRGITYVCAQYPMRSLSPLRKIFQGDSQDIIFVDNESIFKEALKTGRYQDYFRDAFGGDFGHCTQKGNRLLAENIANAILKEVFSE